MKIYRVGKIGLLALLLFFVLGSFTYAEVSIVGSPVCKDLKAGKRTDAGNVCVEVNDDILLVVYTTTGGWELEEAHLWIGADLSEMPRTRKGNPKVGRFPYHSHDITGQQIYIFSIPLTEIGGDNYYDTLCDQTYLAAAHASVRIPDGNGGYRTESAWAKGTRIVSQARKRNWGMYFDFQFTCTSIPPQPECGTAFAYGDKELWDILDPNGNPITNSWGWQITVYPGTRTLKEIYIGAEQNNPNNGTHVGYLYISYSGTVLIVEYYTFIPYYMSETNLYVGKSDTTTADPGQFGHSHTLHLGDRTDVYHMPITGDPIYIVGHAVVCQSDD